MSARCDSSRGRRVRQRSAGADHRRGRRGPVRRARRERSRRRAGGDRARRGAERIDRAVGRPHPGGGHALPARAGHRGFGEAVRRRHCAQGAWRGRREAGAGGRARTRGRRSSGWRTLTRMPFEVITDFNYPGHSAHRMHGLPSRTGAELIDRLRSAAEARDIPILTGRVCETLFADEDGFIEGVEVDGATARAKPSAAARWCSPATAMAAIPNWCGGTFPRWPTRSISAIRATRAMRVLWGEALGARLGVAVRLSGPRLGRDAAQHPDHLGGDHGGRLSGEPRGPALSNEALGYSEAAARGAAPAGRHRVRYFRRAHRRRSRGSSRISSNAEKAGRADHARIRIEALAARIGVPADALQAEFDAIELGKPDRFGRVIEKQARSAVLRHQGDRRAVPHPGRARDRRRSARAAAERQAVPESVRGRRRGGRRVGLAGVRLSVGQWIAHRDGVRADRREPSAAKL